MTDPEHERRVEAIAEARRVRAQFLATLEGERMTKWSRNYFADLAERVGSTFLQTLIPAAVAAQNLVGLDWVNALELAGSAAGIALLKGLLANMADSESGASILPAPPGPVVEDDIEH